MALARSLALAVKAPFTNSGPWLQHARAMSSVASELPSVWVFLGPPGVGKGTYSTRVAKAFGMDHIAAGDLVRAEMKSGSKLGQEMKEVVNSGSLLPDSMILKVMREHMEHSISRGVSSFLLDGFPRTAQQAGELQGLANVQLALNLSLREEVLIEKCLGRRICAKCGTNYNIADIYLPADGGRPEIVMPPLAAPAGCVPHLEQRSDDNENTIRRRIDVYKAEAKPVEDFYAARDLLVDFEITGGIPETLPRLLETLREVAGSTQAVEAVA